MKVQFEMACFAQTNVLFLHKQEINLFSISEAKKMGLYGGCRVTAHWYP